jgi:hypothetical protein
VIAATIVDPIAKRRTDGRVLRDKVRARTSLSQASGITEVRVLRRLIDEDTSRDSPWRVLVELVRATPHLTESEDAKLRMFARIVTLTRDAGPKT